MRSQGVGAWGWGQGEWGARGGLTGTLSWAGPGYTTEEATVDNYW